MPRTLFGAETAPNRATLLPSRRKNGGDPPSSERKALRKKPQFIVQYFEAILSFVPFLPLWPQSRRPAASPCFHDTQKLKQHPEESGFRVKPGMTNKNKSPFIFFPPIFLDAFVLPLCLSSHTQWYIIPRYGNKKSLSRISAAAQRDWSVMPWERL